MEYFITWFHFQNQQFFCRISPFQKDQTSHKILTNFSLKNPPFVSCCHEKKIAHTYAKFFPLLQEKKVCTKSKTIDTFMIGLRIWSHMEKNLFSSEFRGKILCIWNSRKKNFGSHPASRCRTLWDGQIFSL